MRLQHWNRPWAWLDGTGSRYSNASDNTAALKLESPGWICVDQTQPFKFDGHTEDACEEFQPKTEFRVYSLPLPLRHLRHTKVTDGAASLELDMCALPERPLDGIEITDAAQQRATDLLDRVKFVWARIREVEETLADPATMWPRLAEIWLGGEAAQPEMDVIVRHSHRLPAVLDHLDRAPRRILRRAAQMIPLARVQEMDRKAMLWLARQPGETFAERAGDRQRIQATAREENFDTLENRVLLSYAQLAADVARDYEKRHKRNTASERVRRVKAFGARCRRLERDLIARGVRPASSDVRPNFVLQNNWHYHQVWIGWHELLRRHRELDELWRWQARSWEEFCALATVVATQTIPGAQPVALSPIIFGDEQNRGCWIENVNPVAVFFLPEQEIILEVSYRNLNNAPAGKQVSLASFGAPVWLRAGRLGSSDFLKRWPIWPLWSVDGGLEPDEEHEIAAILSHGRQLNVKGAITIRPARSVGVEVQEGESVDCLTLGVSGEALRAGIAELRRVILCLVAEGIA